MKKFINLAFLVLSCVSVLSAQSFIDKNFGDQLNDSEMTRVTVGSKAFSMMANFSENLKDEEAKKLTEIASKVKSFDLIVQEKSSNAATLYSEAISKARGFEELVKVRSKDANVSIRIKERNNIISQIIGVIAADSTFVLFDLEGELNINEIGTLTGKMSESNLNKVFKGKNLNMTEVNVYPNPVGAGRKFTFEAPAALEKGKLNILSADGKKVKEVSVTAGSNEIDTMDLPKGTYNLVLEQGGVLVSRKLVVE